jgi:hypothetical protein
MPGTEAAAHGWRWLFPLFFRCYRVCARFCLRGAGIMARASSHSSRPSPLTPLAPAPLGAQMVLKNVAASAKIMKDLEVDTSVDWAAWEAKLGAELVAEVKAITEKSVAAAQADTGDDAMVAGLTAEVNDAFKGPNGLVRLCPPPLRARGPMRSIEPS